MDSMKVETKIVAFRLPQNQLETIKQYLREKSVKENRNISLSDFIRDAIRKEMQWDIDEK